MRKPDPSVLGGASSTLRVIQLDVTDECSVASTVKEGIAAFGGIDVLVNNAGIGLLSAFEATPLTTVREQPGRGSGASRSDLPPPDDVRNYARRPRRDPEPAVPGPFVPTMNTTYAVCFILVAAGLLASLVRGSRRGEATEV